MIDSKVVVVLNKDLESGVALNAAAHMALGLAARAAAERQDDLKSMIFQTYLDRDKRPYPFISGLSLIVLRGKNGELKRFDAECRQANILSTSFVNDMTGGTYVEQLERLATKSSEEVVFYGVCAFGAREVLDPLTRKLSLWK